MSNLNSDKYWKKRKGKRRPYKCESHEIFHKRGRMKIVGKEDELRECKECHRFLPTVSYTTASQRSDGALYLKKICRECSSRMIMEGREVKAKAPPKPDSGQCYCCHKKNPLQCDHAHGTTEFRGWICKSCNVGLGELGDNLQAVLQAAIYLESDTNKIIKTLHEVYNEMFARTFKFNDE